jgi:serine/threonine protein kinase
VWNYSLLAASTKMNNGEYTVNQRLSKGGMGAIYLAKQNIANTSRQVVIKELLDYFDPADLVETQKANRRFLDEARTLVSINYPGIPQIYDYFSDLGHNYIVMQYIDGQDLSEGLSRTETTGTHFSGKSYPLEDVLNRAIQVCQILEYLSKQNPPIIHHNIKPANLIIDRTTGDIRLVDFGTAKARLVAQAGGKVGLQKSSIFGTQGYAPPEQFSGSSESRSDVYALGATLYHCLTDDDPSDHPFDFPEMHSLPPDLARALSKSVESDVSLRSSASELRSELEAIQKKLSSGSNLFSEYVVVLQQIAKPMQPTAEKTLTRLGFTPGKTKVLAFKAPTVVYRGTSQT